MYLHEFDGDEHESAINTLSTQPFLVKCQQVMQRKPNEANAIGKIGNPCFEYGCIKCCLNTEMELSSSDIVRIRGLGFSEDFFIVEKNERLQLRNSAGRCVFHNGRQCTIYNDRPEGCRLYPAIFYEDTGETGLDSYCPYYGKFQLTPSISRRVVKLVRKLDVETERRLRSVTLNAKASEPPAFDGVP